MNQPPQQGWAPLPAPPQMAPPPQMQMQMYPRPKPSGIYKALGIIQIALGAAGVLWAFVSIGTTLLGTSMSSGLYDTQMLVYTFFHIGMSIVTGAMLVATGIGIVKAKKWSRLAGIAYAAISIGETVLGTAFNLLVLQPALVAKMGMPAGTAGTMRIFTTVSAMLGALFVLILPTVTLIMLVRAKAKEELDA